MSAFLFCQERSGIVIEEYIESGMYKEALDLLTDLEDEKVRYLRLICLYGLEQLQQAKHEGMVAKVRANETYYDVVSIYLSILKDLEEFEEAINLVIEELSMPYIPYQYETMFNAAYDALLLAKQEANMLVQNKTSIFNEDELIRILTNEVNEDLIYMAIDQLNGMNVRRFLHDIAFFLKDESKPALAKSLLLEILIEQQVEEEFYIHKNGEILEVNPFYLTKVEESESMGCIAEYLYRWLEDENPTLLMTCLEFLSYFLYQVFPTYIDDNEYSLIASAIHYYLATMQGIEMDLEEVAYNYQVESDEIIEKIELLKQIEV